LVERFHLRDSLGLKAKAQDAFSFFIGLLSYPPRKAFKESGGKKTKMKNGVLGLTMFATLFFMLISLVGLGGGSLFLISRRLPAAHEPVQARSIRKTGHWRTG